MDSSNSMISEEGQHGGAIFGANIDWSSAEGALPWEYQQFLSACGQGWWCMDTCMQRHTIGYLHRWWGFEHRS